MMFIYRVDLLCWSDRVLCRFSDTELDDRLCLDLNRFPSLRIAVDARGSLCLYQFAKGRDRELAVFLRILYRRRSQQFSKRRCLLGRQFKILRGEPNLFSLGHLLCRSRLFSELAVVFFATRAAVSAGAFFVAIDPRFERVVGQERFAADFLAGIFLATPGGASYGGDKKATTDAPSSRVSGLV
jgi:hypothetical protein